MTVSDLESAEAAYRQAASVVEELREKRNAVLLAALADGMTHAEAARITGLTRGRIGQIAMAANAR